MTACHRVTPLMSPSLAGLRCPHARFHRPVTATAAARLGVAFVANCLKISDDFLDEAAPDLVRVQWGGSLLEEATLDAPVKIIPVAHHSLAPAPPHTPSTLSATPPRPTLAARSYRTTDFDDAQRPLFWISAKVRSCLTRSQLGPECLSW